MPPTRSHRATKRRASRRGRRHVRRPHLEPLESRWLLATVFVNSTTDHADSTATSIADLIAAPGHDGVISLREAIIAANATSGADTIAFNIPYGAAGHKYYRNDNAPGVSMVADVGPTGATSDSEIADIDPDWMHSWWSIAAPGGLPTITNELSIDGYSQPGSVANSKPVGNDAVHRIEIDFANWTGDAFKVIGSSNTIHGLVINRAPANAITILSGSENYVTGNFIGTDISGTLARGVSVGVRLGIRSVTTGNHVGGPDPDDRNVIVAGLQFGPQRYAVYIHNDWTTGAIQLDNTIQGNYLGTNAEGSAALQGGFGHGIFLFDASANQIKDNLISGTLVGIGLKGDGPVANNVIQGNLIGLDATGSSAIPNLNVGIFEDSVAEGTLIGGTEPGARNVISGNTGGGGTAQAIRTHGGYSSPIRIQGNYIGTDVTGTKAVPNDFGIVAHGWQILIGGTEPGAGNLISGNTQYGISKGNGFGLGPRTIQGNLIGTNAAGTATIANGVGILIQSSTYHDLIGGTTPEARNVISGNGTGVMLYDSSTVVQGNYIGTDITGTLPLGNQHGVRVLGEFVPVERALIGGDTSGAGNLIAYNVNEGVSVDLRAQDRATILGNLIHDNGGLGIELYDRGVFAVPTIGPTPNDNNDADDGPNAYQNYPVLSSVLVDTDTTTISGSLNSIPDQSFRIEFFVSAAIDPTGYGEGGRYLGFTNVTTDGAGNASFSVPLPMALPAGHFVTATATRLQREAWWAGDGTAIDVIGGHNGKLFGGAAYAPGVREQAFSFDGVDGVVSTPLQVDYRGGVTFDAWVKTTDVSAAIMGDGAESSDHGLSLFLNDGAVTLIGQASLYIAGTYIPGATVSRSNFIIRGPVIADGAFHHVAATWTGDTTPDGVKLYVDGVLVGTATAEVRGSIGTRTMQLGGHTVTPFSKYAGLIDEPHVAYRPLSAEEIQGIVATAGAERTRGVSFVPLETSEFSVNRQVVILNQPPVADAGGPYFVHRGATVTLDASGTTDVDEPNSNLTYQWDFDGDGQYDDATGMTPTFSATGLPAGARTVGLLVTDSTLKSSIDTAVLTIVDCPPVLTGLVSHWAAENNAHDLFGVNNGTLQNGVAFSTGKVGQAFNFNGGSYVEVPSAPNLNLTGTMTIEGWFYFTTHNFNNGLVFKGPLTGSQGSYSLITGGSNRLTFRLNGSASEGAGQVTANTSLTPGQWYHVAATYDQSSQKIYVNGVLDASRSYSSPLATNNSSLIIGGYYTTSYLFRGLVDELGIYNRALSPGEIQNIYQVGNSGGCQNGPPVASHDSYVVAEDSTLTVATPGVLDNDQDVDGDILTAQLVTGPAHGTLTFHDNGSFVYVPEPNYEGADVFTYRVSDGAEFSNVAQVTLSVTAVNDAPSFVAGPDQAVGVNFPRQTVPAWATDVSAGPFGEEQQTLAFALTNDNPGLFLEQPAIEVAIQGDIPDNFKDDDGDGTVDEPDDPYLVTGTLTYTLAPGATGSAKVTVVLQDDGGTANGGQDRSLAKSFTIASLRVNDPPVIETVSNSSPICGGTIYGEMATVTASFYDPNVEDTHTATIDWGDGTVTQGVVNQVTNRITGNHRYSQGGIYAITVTVHDGVASESTTSEIYISGVGLVDGVLTIIGTDYRDHIRVDRLHRLDSIRVRAHFDRGHQRFGSDGGSDGHGDQRSDGGSDRGHDRHKYVEALFSAHEVTSVVVYGCDGDDRIRIGRAGLGGSAGHSDGGSDGESGGGSDGGREGGSDAGSDGDRDDGLQWTILTTIHAGRGNDHVWGGGGDDTIDGGEGDDLIHSRGGNDRIIDRFGDNRIWSGPGDDSVTTGDGDDVIHAGAGDDRVEAGDGHNRVWGGKGNDRITGGAGRDQLWGGRGNDVILAGSGNDHVDAGRGNDIVVGGDGDDLIHGGSGRDLLIGGLGSDRLSGGADDDLLVAGRTDYDTHLAALDALLAEWSRSADYTIRVQNVQSGGGSLIGLGVLLNNMTVHDDDDYDVLEGDGGRDLFFYNFTGARRKDRAQDITTRGGDIESRTDLD